MINSDFTTFKGQIGTTTSFQIEGTMRMIVYSLPKVHFWFLGNLQALGPESDPKKIGEILTSSYLQEGIKVIDKLNGSFVFVIYDQIKEQLFLGRDLCGQHHLFYAVKEDRLLFSNHPKEIKDGTLLRMDPLAIHYFFDWQSIPAPLTIWQGIKKLRAGEIVMWKGGHLTSLKINESVLPPFKGSFSEACLQVRDVVSKVLAEYRKLYVPTEVATSLSGGIDSTIVTSLWQRLAGATSKAITLGFRDKEFDETKQATQTAEHLNLQQEILLFEPPSFEKLKEILGEAREPVGDAAFLALRAVAKYADDKTKVILTGDGGDEFFAGYYRTHFLAKIAALDQFPLELLKKGIQVLLPFPKIKNERSWVGKIQRIIKCLKIQNHYRALYSRFLAEERCRYYSKTFCAQLQQYEKKDFAPVSLSFADLLKFEREFYLTTNLADKQEFAFQSLNLRPLSPFLDQRLRQLVYSFPISYFRKDGKRKAILKEAFKDILGCDLLHSPKKGFGVPVSKWLREQWRDGSRAVVVDPVWDEYFDKGYLLSLWQEHQANTQDHSVALFAILSLYFFSKKYTISQE